jgi:hypothetical protein
MKKNIGTTDRLVRLVLAAILILLTVLKVLTGTWAIIALIVSAVLILTSVIKFCPLYCPLHINTSKSDDKGYGCCGGDSCSTK